MNKKRAFFIAGYIINLALFYFDSSIVTEQKFLRILYVLFISVCIIATMDFLKRENLSVEEQDLKNKIMGFGKMIWLINIVMIVRFIPLCHFFR